MYHLKNSWSLTLLLFSLTLCTAGYAQSSESIQDSIFANGVKQFASKNITASFKQFDTLAKNPSWTKNRIETNIFLAKIALTRYQYPKAESILKELKKSYPRSVYTSEIMFTLTEALWRQKKKFEAFTTLTQLGLDAGSDSLRRKVLEAGAAFINKVPDNEVESIIQPYKENKQGIDFVSLVLGLAAQSRGEYQTAKDYFSSVVTKYPGSSFYTLAVAYKEKSEDTADAGQTFGTIAVLLPLSSDEESSTIRPVQEILDGVKLAIDRWNGIHGNSLGLEIYDTKSDTNTIKEIVRDLKKIGNLRAVIGPLFSQECRYFLKAATDLKVPLLSPTATDEALTALSANFYQLNPPFSKRGKLAAQYAFNVEQKHKIAVLYSEDQVSEVTATGFIKEFIKLGGEIVEMKYKNERTDLANAMAPLKTAANDCDGLFAPISDKRFVSPVFSALTRMGVTITIYGNQEWINAPGLETSSDLSSQLTIISDNFIDFADTAFISLNALFYQATGYEINKNVCYGYGAAQLTIESLRKTKPTQDLGETLKSISFNGLHNNYLFDANRINPTINVIRFINGKYYLIERRSGND